MGDTANPVIRRDPPQDLGEILLANNSRGSGRRLTSLGKLLTDAIAAVVHPNLYGSEHPEFGRFRSHFPSRAPALP